MVQVVENWAELRGRVEAIAQDEQGGLSFTVRVSAIETVSGFPNLLGDLVGKTIAVQGPAFPEAPRVGDDIRCRARKAAPGRYFYAVSSLMGG